VSVTTHCLPNGSLGVDELPIPNIKSNLTTMTPVGLKRGVVVLMHGMLTNTTHTIPLTLENGLPFLPVRILALANDLVSNGWVVLYPIYQEDLYVGIPSQGVYNDINSDTGNGARYLNNLFTWWDHMVVYIRQTYGSWPIVPMGVSWGGYRTIQVAANRTSTIAAYATHVPPTVLSQASPAWTPPVNFGLINTSGLNIASNRLNSVTSKPGIIGWGTADSAVGFTNIQALYNTALAAGCPVTSNPRTTDHILDATDVTTYINWFQSTVHPLAPAVY